MTNYHNDLVNYILSMSKRTKLALHSCCAPCSSYVLEFLNDFFDVTVFFYNPNIHPLQEYQHRLCEQKRLCAKMNVPLVECEYDPQVFFERTKDYKTAPEGAERCEICFKMRLDNTARLAKSAGFDLLCTTLTVSPHKNAEIINSIGYESAKKYGLEWLPSDFKKRGGYQRSIELSRKYELYRQNYCGCIYSDRGKTNSE